LIAFSALFLLGHQGFMTHSAMALSCASIQTWGFINMPSSESKSRVESVPRNSRGVLWWGEFDQSSQQVPVRIFDREGASLKVEYEQYFKRNVKPDLWLFRPQGGFKTGETYTFKTYHVV